MIIQCECKHEFQDRQYGFSNRVYNRGVKVSESTETSEDGKRKKIKSRTYKFRCSVCRKEINREVK